jgi:arylformamidase
VPGVTNPDIDAQLNTRARAPHYDAVNAAYAALSDAARSRLALTPDLPYGPHPLERIDILRPSTPLRGVMVWVHGGVWRTRDKHDFHFLASGFARLGLATIAVGYPKCPDVSLGRIADAAVAALDKVLAGAGDWGFEALPIFVGGHSAGAHLATLAVIARPDRVAGLIAVSGLYDLKPVKQSFANAHLNLNDADVAVLSPIAHPVPNAPPAVFLSGENETAEFQRQASAMAGSWTSVGAPAVTATARAADHYTILFALSGGHHPAVVTLLNR